MFDPPHIALFPTSTSSSPTHLLSPLSTLTLPWSLPPLSSDFLNCQLCWPPEISSAATPPAVSQYVITSAVPKEHLPSTHDNTIRHYCHRHSPSLPLVQGSGINKNSAIPWQGFHTFCPQIGLEILNCLSFLPSHPPLSTSPSIL